MLFNTYFIDVITDKYSDFSGRARRSEFWFFILFKWLILSAIVFMSDTNGEETLLSKIGFAFFSICLLILIIPTLALSVRRLHDSGNSGWLITLGIIPIIGSIILLIFFFLDSEQGSNKYGSDPHEITV